MAHYHGSKFVKGGRPIRGGEFAEDVRQRALMDAKGLVLRRGMFYTAKHPDGLPWVKRRSLLGRTDQIELVYAGKVRVTTGETLLRNELRWVRGQ